MKLAFLWVFFLHCSSLTNASDIENYSFHGKDKQSFYACGYAMRLIGTFCKASVKGYKCYCTNDNAMLTFTGCLATTGRNTNDVYKFYMYYCEEYYEVKLEHSQLVAAYDRYLTDAKNSTQIPGFNVSQPVDVPLIVANVTYIKLLDDAYKVFYNNFDIAFWAGIGGMGYWALVALIAMVCNWGVVVFPESRNVLNGTFSKLFRKYITLPALGRRKRNVQQNGFSLFDCLVPTRMESLIILGFFVYLLTLCAIEIYYVPNDPIFPTLQMALTRYVADRTGILSTILTPMLLLFGGRNNFLQWVTRWKFSTMVVYHRWIARMIVALAFIHSVGYTYIYAYRGYYAEEMKETWLIWGVVATTCGGVICFQGLLFLRRRAYETFLVLHILLALFWVIGVWFHVSIMGYSQFMYACFAVWGFDRLARVVRLCWFGFPKATLLLLPDDTLRVEVPKPKSWPSISGGHAWIHLLHPLTFWQNHPFTFVDSVEKENTIVFFCKIKKGLTASFCKKLRKYPGQTTTLRVAVDGPYGEPSPVASHSTALYVAGGSGIPGIYSEATAMARNSENSNRKIKLMWVVRELASVAGFTRELHALKELQMETVVYITRQFEVGTAEEFFNSSDLSLEKDKKSEAEPLSFVQNTFPHIEFRSGRPELEQIIVEELTFSQRSLAIVTCGNPILVDDLRYIVVKHIDGTEKRLDYYEQLQVWA